MEVEQRQYLWIPYVIIGTGIICSILFALLLWKNLQIYIDILTTLQDYLPWLALSLGMGISILVGFLVRLNQLTRQQAISLHLANEDLKKASEERLLAEDSKQKLEIALLQGQKLQSIGTLAGGIAHDFNNLLYAIIGYTEMSREDVAKDTLIYKNLGRILDACHRGQELIARILAFSRRQHHHFEKMQLNQTIEAVLALMMPTIPASVQIHYHSNGNIAILGNQTQIHQVLVNMINNAVDAMDGEGEITIEVKEIATNDPYLNQFPEKKPTAYCRIDIKDTGHGMDQTTMERIFEPFYTTKEVGKGTGLGLSIVHSIIQEHQGNITVSSQLGQGSTFTILLPEHQT